MNDIFSYTKLFTILLSIFYISALACVFYHFEILAAFIVFLILAFLVVRFNLGFKKALILYLIFFTGIIRAHQVSNLESILSKLNINQITLKGQIVSNKNVTPKNNRVKFYLRADDAIIFNKKYENINSKILVSIDITDNIEDKIIIGDYVEVKGKLRTPKPASNPYQFDYKNYLLNNDTQNILYADSIDVIKKIKLTKNKRDIWYYVLQKFELTRNKIIEKHSKNIKSPRLEILGGIVFGNETINPDETIKENFKNSGLLHLLAASGLNVALIYGIWWWIANLVRFPYHLSIFIGAIFVIFYTFMTGFPPSILRASIMLLFVLFGKLIDKNADSVALIFFVAFLILLFCPKMLFDVGFQLSFAVTLGLITCCNVIVSKFDKSDKKFTEKHKKSSRFKKYFIFLLSPKSIASIIAVPLVAQIWVVPLQMHYFNNFAPFSMFANIAVVPFIGILSFIGFLSSIIALIPVLNEPIVFVFDFIANPLLALLIKISEFFASFKISLIYTMGLNVFQIFLFWGTVLLFVLNLKHNFKNKKHSIVLAICLVVFSFSFIKTDAFRNELEVMMFDVENADSFLIKTPKNKFIMIDTGKKPYKGISSAEAIINRYLKNERIKKLQLMIITHFDMDHCGGALEILKSTKTKEILIQKKIAKSALSENILKYLDENKMNYKEAKNNEIIYQEKDLTIRTFTPRSEEKLNSDKFDNETSIIVLLEYKDKNILFMADAGVLGYQDIEKYINKKIDIIKIGHHGAKDVVNKNMLEKLNPDYALISTGINKFNHPHYSTITQLEDKNIKIISTRNWGFVKIILNKNDIKFFHFNNSSKKLEDITFDRDEEIPFHKTKYTQNFIKNNAH